MRYLQLIRCITVCFVLLSHQLADADSGASKEKCLKEMHNVKQRCEKEIDTKTKQCLEKYVSTICQGLTTGQGGTHLSERCTQELQAASLCVQDATSTDAFMRCIAAGSSSECGADVRQFIEAAGLCKETQSRLCGNAIGSLEIQKCMKGNQAELISACHKSKDQPKRPTAKVRPEVAKAWSELQPFSPSNPELAAFGKWHNAALIGDYEALKSFMPGSMRSFSSNPELLRRYLNELLRMTPIELKIGSIKTLPTGAKQFRAAGCVFIPQAGKDILVLAEIIVVQEDNEYKVLVSGWGPPWNEMYDKCPI